MLNMSENHDGGVTIKITHFINPHMFWFQDTEASTEIVDTIEEAINKLYNSDVDGNLCKRNQAFAVDEIVAVKHHTWNRYVRGKIVHISELVNFEFTYILWIVDYGFTCESKNKHLQKLPLEYAKLSPDIVHLCSISDVMPGILCQFGPNGRTTIESKLWTKDAIQATIKLLKEATTIKFIQDQKQICTNPNQKFGCIKLNFKNNRTIDLKNFLIKHSFAIQCNDFMEKFNKIKMDTNQLFMNNNCEFNVIEENLVSKTKPVKNQLIFKKEEETNNESQNNELKNANEIQKSDVDESIYKILGRISKLNRNQSFPRIPSDESFSFDDFITTPPPKENRDDKVLPNESYPTDFKNVSSLDFDTFNCSKLKTSSELSFKSENSSENGPDEISACDQDKRIDKFLKLRMEHRKLLLQKKVEANKTCNNKPQPSYSHNYIPAGFDLRNLQPERNWEYRGRKINKCK